MSPEKSVETLSGACPLCGGDVKGDNEHKFFCSGCNILFEKAHLARKEQKTAPQTARGVDQAVTPKPIRQLQKQDRKSKYIVSLHSDRYHRYGCRYTTQIKEDNLFYFNTSAEAEAKSYIACKCVRDSK